MDEQRACGLCGGRNRIIGRSGPSVLHLQCQDCGCTTTASASKTSAESTNAGRIALLVSSVIADFSLPFELLTVTEEAESCEVIVRGDSRQIVRFQVKPTALAAMRSAIKQTLENQK